MTSNKSYKDYQEGLIKSLIAVPTDITEVVRIITEDDFSDSNYQLIYSAMLQLNREQKSITLPDVVKQILDESPDAHIDPQWILNLDNDLTKWTLEAPATTWASLLKKESSRNRVRGTLKDALDRTGESDPLELIQEVDTDLNQISLDNVVDDSGDREKDLDDYLEFLQSRLEDKNRTIPSMYPRIDKHTIGWLPGQLITVGARTSVGKTIFAGNCAVAAVASGKSVLMFSLEMGKNELYDRLTSSISMVSLTDIRNQTISPEDEDNYKNAIQSLRDYKLNIDDNANVTVDYIRSKATKKALSAEGLDMIFVDYLQLINNPNRGNHSRQESVAEISRELKILAKQLGIPIMVLVQLKREDKDDTPDTLPKLSDIRESGAIAQDSDIVILIHRDLASQELNPKAQFILAKNRNGSVGNIISVRAKMAYATFEDKAPETAEEFNPDDQIQDINSQNDAFSNEITQPETAFTEGTF